MDNHEILSSALKSLAIQSPTLLAMLVGFVIALIRWPRHPAVSALVLMAVSVSILTMGTAAFVYAGLPWLRDALDIHNMQIVYRVVNVISMILYAVAWGLLLTAAFGWRNAPR